MSDITDTSTMPAIALCIGTRPEIIKIAPVVHALQAARLRPILIHSGQHDSMAWPLYKFFDLKPDAIIDLKRTSSTLAHLGSRLLDTLTAELENHKPAALLVHGDTSTALMGALAGFYQQIPIGHVEAGLRTHQMYDPFPEEKNRELIGRLARWHFAPTQRAAKNLSAEGITQGIFETGNTAVDAALYAVKRLETYWQESPESFPESLKPLRRQLNIELNNPGAEKQRLLLVTAHRRENWGAGITAIAEAIRDWLIAHPNYTAVWPVHGNPAVAQIVQQTFAAHRAILGSRLLLTEPLDYAALLWVMRQAWMILTDSGGIQEEAAALNLPVLVLRDTTERPELLETGRGLLTGAKRANIHADMTRLHSDNDAYELMKSGLNPFGNGTTATQIAKILTDTLGS